MRSIFAPDAHVKLFNVTRWHAGRGAVINNTTQQVAMHKDKRLQPVMLTVSRISGIAEDSQFLGVMEVRMPAGRGACAHAGMCIRCCVSGARSYSPLADLYIFDLVRKRDARNATRATRVYA
jgi:hypothetical protein